MRSALFVYEYMSKQVLLCPRVYTFQRIHVDAFGVSINKLNVLSLYYKLEEISHICWHS